MTFSEHSGPLRIPVVYLIRSNPHLLQTRATMMVDTVMFAYASTLPLAAFGLQRCYSIGSGPIELRQVHMALANWFKSVNVQQLTLRTCSKHKFRSS